MVSRCPEKRFIGRPSGDQSELPPPSRTFILINRQPASGQTSRNLYRDLEGGGGEGGGWMTGVRRGTYPSLFYPSDSGVRTTDKSCRPPTPVPLPLSGVFTRERSEKVSKRE